MVGLHVDRLLLPGAPSGSTVVLRGDEKEGSPPLAAPESLHTLSLSFSVFAFSLFFLSFTSLCVSCSGR